MKMAVMRVDQTREHPDISWARVIALAKATPTQCEVNSFFEEGDRWPATTSNETVLPRGLSTEKPYF